jgi:uncharacterized protein YcaQ
MNVVPLSNEVARRLAIHCQLLDNNLDLPVGKEGVARTIDALGYMQIDTISVVARAHHHGLWVRRSDYDPVMLHELLAHDRRVYEYWGHAASYLPMSDFRYTLPLKEKYRRPPTRKWEQERIATCGHMLEPVIERIREEGPLRSRDFDPPPGKRRGTWWDWKPAKTALELLFWRGALMISERRGFQRVYDLAERVLPADVDTRMPDDNELGRFLIRRALLAHGFAPAREIHDHLRGTDLQIINATLGEMVEAGEIVPIEVESMEDLKQYALPEMVDKAENIGPQPETVSLLSPFDNLIIQRKRTQQLFDFNYTLECYVPAPKRLYGYFVFTILYADKLVGRFDPKADRKAGVLYVRRLLFEPGFDVSDHLLTLLAEKLREYAVINGCDAVVVEEARTKNVVRRLRKELK